MSNKIKVMLVDDSRLIQQVMKTNLEEDGRFEVISQAYNPVEALEILNDSKPNVMVVDVEMPHMNGLEFLKALKKRRVHIPSIIFTSLSKLAADLSIQAMEAGASNVFEKPKGRNDFNKILTSIKEELIKIAEVKVKPTIDKSNNVIAEVSKNNKNIILIGSSTGGVNALSTILPQFPKSSPAILVVQHMPEGFTHGFAARMNSLCKMKVKEAENGEQIEAGQIYIAPGGDRHMMVQKDDDRLRIRLKRGDKVSGHRPSVDVLFDSFVTIDNKEPIAVVMTGMGADGALGMKHLNRRTQKLFVQSEATSVVYGMPKVALELSPSAMVVDLEQIPQAVINSISKK